MRRIFSIPMTRAQIIRLLQEYPYLARRILKMLPNKEAYVIGNLYGLAEGGPCASGIRAPRRPADLARELELTLFRVYQLRRHGLILICHPKRKQVIVKYIFDNMIRIEAPKINGLKSEHGIMGVKNYEQ
jgi:CRP-like cAMP-binding protein